MPSAPRPNRLAQINELAADRATEASRIMCQATIDLTYDAVKVLLEADTDEARRIQADNYPAGALRGHFVLQDRLVAPLKGGNFQRTYSIQLEPQGGLTNDKEQRRDTSNEHDMRLHVPLVLTPDGVYDLPEKPDVEEIYVELSDQTETHWYAIGQAGLYEYIPYVHQDEASSVLSDEGIWQWLNDRIPENVETISSILRRADNWRAVPQRIETIQDLKPYTDK